MNNIYFPLTSPVNTDSFDTTLDTEKISFREKNTVAYENVLRSPRINKGPDAVSTTGKNISVLGSPSDITIRCGDFDLKTSAEYYLDEVKEIKPPVSGEVTDVKANYDTKDIFYLVKQSNGDYVYCKNNVVVETIKRDSRWVDFACFLSVDGKRIKSYVDRRSYIYLECEGHEQTFSDWNNLTGQTTVKPYAFNNGEFYSWDNYTIGADGIDQYRVHCYSPRYGHKLYLGCVGRGGLVTGEPFPYDTSLNKSIKPIRLNNGVLKWNASAIGAEIMNDVNANLGETQLTIGETGGTASWSAPTVRRERMVYGYDYSGNFIYVNSSRAGQNTSSGIDVVDVSSDMGAYWKIANLGEFDNVFPQVYVFTNYASNRGKFYDYGPGWARCTVQIRNYEYNTTTKSVYPLTSPVMLSELKDYDDNNNCYLLEPLNSSNISNDGKAIGDGSQYAGAENYIKFTNNDKLNGIYWRRHSVTQEEIASKQLLNWVYFLGDTMENGIVNDIPFVLKAGSFDSNAAIYVQYYAGLPVSASFNKTLITTASTEMKAFSCKGSYVGNDVICTDPYVYFIRKLTSIDQVKVFKLADFKFCTNLITQWNFINESRDGTFEILRGNIPYIMEGEWDVKDVPTLLPSDGGASNDVWLQGSGHNVNLKDNDVTVSYLLPPIEVPIYVDPTNLDKFNKEVIKKVKPLIKVNREQMFNEDTVDVYFTHTLDTTDCKYRATIKGNGEQTYNTLLDENTYWLEAQTTIFPIGLGSQVKGINYIAPTVKLPGNYSARLYTSSNTAFLGYNISSQVYYGDQVFTIYTSSFYYDEQAIYYVGGTNESTQNSFVCYAIGMDFLGNSGTEAFFYSRWEKRLYVFTGSATLQAGDSFARFGEIVDTCYSSHEQALYILFDDGHLYARTQRDSFLLDCKDITNPHLEGTTLGCAVVGDNGWMYYSPVNGEISPLNIETSFIGDDGSLFKYSFVDCVLYNVKDDCELDIEFVVLNGIEQKSTVLHKAITKSEWKGRNLRIRLTPNSNSNIGTSFKIRIKSDDDIAVSYISVGLDKQSAVPGAKH